MSKKNVQNTDSLIESLVGDLIPVSVLPHPLRRFVPFFILAVIYLISTTTYFGIRSDIMDKLTDPMFLFELSLVFAMSLSAGLCAIWLCVPDMRGQHWIISVALSLFGVFSAWIGFQMLLNFSMPHISMHPCYLDAIVFGAVPALAIIILSIRGKTTHPLLLSMMNTVSMGGAGYIGLRMTCHADSIDHICCYHILPYILFGAVAGVVGRRIYRW